MDEVADYEDGADYYDIYGLEESEDE